MIVDPQYAPLPRVANKFLAFLPHISDMRQPVPLNMTPEEVYLVYDSIMAHCQRNAQVAADPEELDLYSGSINQLPADW